ncbi:UNVERIFIED_CONTAM: hypothetical protein HDU68_009353 [Siphonaria sp. JEL0065]|nr:hypothetical protein HDU68_009353 [Siphonaria sp. JEL0065]
MEAFTKSLEAHTKLPISKLVSIAAVTLVATSFLVIAIRQSFRTYGRGYIPGSEMFKRSRGKSGKGVGWKNPKRSGAKGRGGALAGNVFRGSRPATGLKGIQSRRF